MTKKVTWKRGMRLGAELFTAADDAAADALRLVALLASTGRYGLFPAPKAFQLSMNIDNNFLEVSSLSCHGVTKSGRIIDIEFDSNYTNTVDTRLAIPHGADSDAYLLVVKMHGKQWREIDMVYSEPKYTFELVGVNSKVDDDSLPVGCIVYQQGGWRLNDFDFVPPCLSVSSHVMYVRQYERAYGLFKHIADCCLMAERCVAHTFLSVVWPAASNALMRLDKERDILTPGQLQECLQLLVNSFVIGCRLDGCINLEGKDSFIEYAQKAYDARNLYRDIEQGLSLCAEMTGKVEAACSIVEAVRPQEKHPVEKPPKPVEPPKPAHNRWAGIEI